MNYIFQILNKIPKQTVSQNYFNPKLGNTHTLSCDC